MKNLLDEYPLIVLPSLAKAIGLNEAIVLQQIHYWIEGTKKDPCKQTHHFHENCWWVYNTYEQWQSNFPFWSVPTIKRIISSLERQALLKSEEHNKSKGDRTKWYTIDYKVFNALEDNHSDPSDQNDPTHQITPIRSHPSDQNDPTHQIKMIRPSDQNDPFIYRTETTTETTSRDYLIKDPPKPPQRGDVQNESLQGNGENDFSEETAKQPIASNESSTPELPPLSTKAKRSKRNSSAARLAIAFVPNQNPDGFEDWWKTFRESAHRADCRPGDRAEAGASWDLLHEIEHEATRDDLGEKILEGTRWYWEREALKSNKSCRHGCRFLAHRDWQEALEWHEQRSQGQLATLNHVPILQVWNETRPQTWPEADLSDLTPRTVARITEIDQSSQNLLEMLQRALKWCCLDEYFARKIYTLEEFLYSNQIAMLAKKQFHKEKSGQGDRVIMSTARGQREQDAKAAKSARDARLEDDMAEIIEDLLKDPQYLRMHPEYRQNPPDPATYRSRAGQTG